MGIFARSLESQVAPTLASGRVSRIAITDWTGGLVGTSYECHILFDGQPDAVSFGLPNVAAALALTREGDEVRIEIDGGTANHFENLTTGLSARRGGPTGAND